MDLQEVIAQINDKSLEKAYTEDGRIIQDILYEGEMEKVKLIVDCLDKDLLLLILEDFDPYSFVENVKSSEIPMPYYIEFILKNAMSPYVRVFASQVWGMNCRWK